MCLILFAWKSHPTYRLILGANRDEFLARSTQRMHAWGNETGIIAGKDLERGGTWLGVNQHKQFAALTNYREAHKFIMPNTPSRGDLTLDFLKDPAETPVTYLEKLEPQANAYNGFNLLVGDEDHLCHLSNRENKINTITAGIHGLSNAVLDTEWPKVKLGKALLSEVVAQSEVDSERIFELLQHDQQAPDEELPQTGVSLEWERILSPMFIKSGDYGTRCSTVLLWKYDGTLEIMERTYDLVSPKTESFSY